MKGSIFVFLTNKHNKDDQVKFTSNYPNINTISIGKTTTEDKNKVWTELRTESSISSKAWGIANVVSLSTLKDGTLFSMY